MVALQAIRQSNSLLAKSLPSRFTALFVGGTSGIGKSTLRHLAKHTESPSIYIVGRNQNNAKSFITELQRTNPKGTFRFLEADVSHIRNVDRVCQEIKQQEKSMNLLFMTPGGISFSGRNETSEGIDHLFSLRYYARMRFTQNLLPLLESATPFSRVVSILGGGYEGPLKSYDLDLKHNYSILNCALHSTTMTSLAMEHLSAATKSKNLSFVHAFPGIVGTNIYSNSFPPVMAAVYNHGMWPLMWPFSVGLEECGERQLFHSSSRLYTRKRGGQEVGEVAIGSDGERGSGVYLVNWKGETSVGGKYLSRYREEGMAVKVWDHTVELLRRAAGQTGS